MVMVLPLVWMVLTSLKTSGDADNFFNTPKNMGAILWNIFPHPLTWENYKAVFTERPMGTYYFNSAVLTITRIIPSLFLCSLAGFVFSKMKFRGQKWLLSAIILTMMVPFQIKMLTLYEMMVKVGWVDTYWAVIVVGLMEPLGIFLFKQTIDSIPDSLLEAATMDGAKPLQTYFKIILPLIRPTLAAYSIFLFMWSWSDFLWPMIVLSSEGMKPVEVGILGFSDINNPQYVKMMAASTIAILPVLIFFLIMQRQFIKGVTLSGLKD
jgi:ABC-type glycerol-3-phosphate transport system permease component